MHNTSVTEASGIGSGNIHSTSINTSTALSNASTTPQRIASSEPFYDNFYAIKASLASVHNNLSTAHKTAPIMMNCEEVERDFRSTGESLPAFDWEKTGARPRNRPYYEAYLPTYSRPPHMSTAQYIPPYLTMADQDRRHISPETGYQPLGFGATDVPQPQQPITSFWGELPVLTAADQHVRLNENYRKPTHTSEPESLMNSSSPSFQADFGANNYQRASTRQGVGNVPAHQ